MYKLFLILLLLPESLFAATYYSNPAGSGTTCSIGSPCTISTGVGKLSAGDTLILQDGTYTGVGQQLDITVSGSVGNIITIQASNDGLAIIDGSSTTIPCNISNHDYITVSGIVCQNSSGHVFNINSANNIIISRVSAYTASLAANYHIFSLSTVTNSLLEDCAAGGNGRDMYLVIGSSYVTLRRCYGRFKHYVSGGESGDIIQIYGSHNVLAENTIGFIEGSPTKGVGGPNVWANTGMSGTSNNTIIGSVMRDLNYWAGQVVAADTTMHNNRIINNTYIRSKYGLRFSGDDAGIAENNTIIISPLVESYAAISYSPVGAYCGPTWGHNAKNNHLSGSDFGIVWSLGACPGTLTHTYNNYYNINGTPPTYDLYPISGDSTENCDMLNCGHVGYNPSYDTATYGDGAYLMVPTALQGKGSAGGNIGASIIYQYLDGVLTNSHLWPWPMEDRIFAETGISVTYSANGGLWDTLVGVYAFTPGVPTVETESLSNLEATSLTITGEIVDAGGGTIANAACGVAYGVTLDPTTAGDKVTTTGCGSLGTFNINITGLDPCTTYYFRFYATNETDTSYGSNLSSKTRGECSVGDWTQIASTFSVISNTGYGGEPNGGTSSAINTTGANLLIVGLSGENVATTISDSKGNSWSALTASTVDTEKAILYYSIPSSVGSGHTFTVTCTGCSASIFVLAVSGAATSNVFDQQNGAGAGGGSTIQTGSVTPSVNNELLVTVLFPAAGIPVTINSGFTISDSVAVSGGHHWGGSMAYKIQTTAGAENPTWSHTGATSMATRIATFKSNISDEWYTSTTIKPYKVKSGVTTLTHVADDAACPASIVGNNQWCHVDSTDRLYVQTDGTNPGGATILCNAPTTGSLLTSGIGN